MTTFVLYSLLTSSFYYLGSRALITQFMWSKYPPAFAKFMDCAACSGFWFGLVVAIVIGVVQDLPYLGLAGNSPLTPFVVAFCSIVTTPLFAGAMQHALDTLGKIEEIEADQ